MMPIRHPTPSHWVAGMALSDNMPAPTKSTCICPVGLLHWVEFGPLPDQSHEKTSVPSLIEGTFLRQADARELGGLFRQLDAAREQGNEVEVQNLTKQIDNYQTHVVPIIADIDAGFGNENHLSARQAHD